jgi:hypothetical protein
VPLGDVADRERIRDLYGRYSMFADLDADQVVGTFTDDGVLWVGGRGAFRGKVAIREYAGPRIGRVVHFAHNISIRTIRGEIATAHAYFQDLDPNTGETLAWGAYDDILERIEGAWYWKVKRVTVSFRAASFPLEGHAVDDLPEDVARVPTLI